MNYGTIESAIQSRLSSLTGVTVIVLPDVEADFKIPFATAKITVAYKDSKFLPARSVGDNQSQEEMMGFDIIIQAKKRNGTNGIYAIMAAVKARLFGYKPTDCDQIIFPTDEKAIYYLEHKDGIWSYNMLVQCTSLLVQYTDDESLGLATKITLESGADAIVIDTQIPPETP
ncbi:MAG: hypothetical protein D4R97_06460 [Bacteroidetes bacterium]|nr:MAG: hypothetical protein D4R97_06460 [Bacteroidota bacterium]